MRKPVDIDASPRKKPSVKSHSCRRGLILTTPAPYPSDDVVHDLAQVARDLRGCHKVFVAHRSS